jgi:hypothetical protein
MEEATLKRVKLWELSMGILFIFIGLSGVHSGEMYRWGVPILYPKLFGAVLIVVGAAIPILAWFLRSPSRINKKDK